MSFFLFALLLPQAGEARRGTQFQRLRLLALGNLNGFQKTLFCFFCLFPMTYSLKLYKPPFASSVFSLKPTAFSLEPSLRQQVFAFHLIQLRLEGALPSVMCHRQSLTQYPQKLSEKFQREPVA